MCLLLVLFDTKVTIRNPLKIIKTTKKKLLKNAVPTTNVGVSEKFVFRSVFIYKMCLCLTITNKTKLT